LKNEKGVVTAIEALHRFEDLSDNFVCLIPDDYFTQAQIGTFVLYIVTLIHLNGKISKSFRHLVLAPFKGKNIFDLEAINIDDDYAKILPEYYEYYKVYI